MKRSIEKPSSYLKNKNQELDDKNINNKELIRQDYVPNNPLVSPLYKPTIGFTVLAFLNDLIENDTILFIYKQGLHINFAHSKS